MTNEEMIQDLKQFIEATVSQQMAEVATKDGITRLEHRIDGIDPRLDGLEANMATKADIKALDEKLDTIQDAIADALTHSTEATDTTLQDHEQRLRRLEHRAA